MKIVDTSPTRGASPTQDDPAGAPIGGAVLERRLRGDPGQVYYLYVPASAPPGARLLVSVHGVSRNAREHAARFARRAERYGVVLVAPLFPRERFPDYQRLGRPGRGQRADRVLNRIIAEVASLTGADARRVFMFGYSGGGQFVHRYAMAYPERVAAIALGAAGWYTFPDDRCRYPRGLADTGGTLGIDFDPDAFLPVPACVMVGELDGERDAELRQSRRIERQQGETRIERGARWIEAMTRAARARALDTPYRFRLLPGADHSFRRCVRRGRMHKAVFTWLFGPAPAQRDRPLVAGRAEVRPAVRQRGAAEALDFAADSRYEPRSCATGT